MLAINRSGWGEKRNNTLCGLLLRLVKIGPSSPGNSHYLRDPRSDDSIGLAVRTVRPENPPQNFDVLPARSLLTHIIIFSITLSIKYSSPQ